MNCPVLYYDDSNQNLIKLDRTQNITDQLRTIPLNGEEKENITNLCLESGDFFTLENDSLTFTNEIKNSIDKNNAKPIFLKSYRYLPANK